MPQLTTIGPRGFHQAQGVATLGFTPLFDRAAIVRRILIDKPSADDTWVLSTTGQELARFPIYTVGHQQMLGGPSSAVPRIRDLFSFAETVLGKPITYPVAQGQTITVTSVGGATANIQFEYTEHSPGDVRPNMVNGTDSQQFRMPIFLVPPTVTHASGLQEDNYASQIAASFLPSLFGQVQIPAAYRFDIWVFFLEGAGRNTFSGSADHASVTDHVGLVYNGQRMFTRDATEGIPMVGQAAAAGSANTVYGADLTPFPAFQDLVEPECSLLSSPLTLQPGSQLQFLFGTTGDSTGGAAYAKALTGFLADVTLTGMMPQ